MAKKKNTTDLEDFVIPLSHGLDGRSEPIQFRMSPEMASEMDIIVQSRKFPPYETKSHLLRHALYRHMRWLHSLETIPHSIFHQLEAANMLLRMSQMQSNMDQVINSLDKQVNELIAAGHYGEARRLVGMMRYHLGQAADGFWKDTGLRKVAKWEHLISGKDKVDLSEMNED